jgi:predicted negative regulator of RcsB-dependent stress response
MDMLIMFFWGVLILGFVVWSSWKIHESKQNKSLAQASPQVEENIKAWAIQRKEVEKLNKD